jgi:hypothetical protein
MSLCDSGDDDARNDTESEELSHLYTNIKKYQYTGYGQKLGDSQWKLVRVYDADLLEHIKKHIQNHLYYTYVGPKEKIHIKYDDEDYICSK